MSYKDLPRVAVMDDYEGYARQCVDWERLTGLCTIDFLDRKLHVPDEAVEVLKSYDVLCHLRERLPMDAELINRLPRLKFMTVTGKAHRTMDLRAATARGVLVSHASHGEHPSYGTPELTWGLVLAVARRIPYYDRMLRNGSWQRSLGVELHGKTLGILGLGKLGQQVASYGKAFGMKVIAWSPNLTDETAKQYGVERVSKDCFFSGCDVLSIHVVLSERSRHLVGEQEIGQMKPSAILVNTARGPIVDEKALVRALIQGKLAGAGLDVFEEEPLPAGHAFLNMENVVISPHAGYVTQDTFRRFYEGTLNVLAAYLNGVPKQLLNPQVVSTSSNTTSTQQAD